MADIYVMEAYYLWPRGDTLWYALQVSDIGNVVDLPIHSIENEDQLVTLVKHLHRKHRIVVNEPEEENLPEWDIPSYRKITNKHLLEKLAE